MKIEPTDAEINEGIAKFCGWRKCACGDLECGVWYDTKDESQLGPPSYTTSFDALREAMWKMMEGQRNRVLWLLHRERPSDFEYWILYECPARTLAKVVYQVVKGEKL